MNETPLSPSPSIVESPVPDPTLFLMYERNRAYLLGKTALPHLANRDEESNLAGVLLFGGLVAMFLLFGGGTFLMRWLTSNNINLNPTLLVMALFLVVLLTMGVLVVIRDTQLAKASSAGKEGTLASPKPQLFEGTVTHAEKIREEHNVERLGVRYRFVAPGGIVTDGYAEGLCEDASHPMAPVPGTPVKIYYEQEQKYFLL